MTTRFFAASGFLFTACALAAQTACGIATLPTSESFYPPVARAARVEGVVVLLVVFDQQGHTAVSRILNGPPMLQTAASDFAYKTRAAASSGVRECPLVIRFHLGVDIRSCKSTFHPAKPPQLDDPQHITIYGEAVPTCDPAATRHFKRFLFF